MDQIARTAKQMGAIIHRKRRQLQLTQNALGAKIKHRQATISKLEAGEPGIRLGTLLDVIAALNLELVVRPRTKGTPEDIEGLF
jgi:HTH-type transcriptional regulator/antitoxin HipB